MKEMSLWENLYPSTPSSYLKWLALNVKGRYDEYKRNISNIRKYNSRIKRAPSIDVRDGNIIFVVVDCLRADHTTVGNYDQSTTPFLSDIGCQYPNTVSAAPWTYPSVVSILTGQYPHTHGADFDTELRKWDPSAGQVPGKIQSDVITLPEVLGANGYHTYFSTAIRTAEIALRGRFRRMNLEYHEPAESVIDGLFDWWDSHRGNRFGYIQLGDLHGLQNGIRHLPDQRPFGDIERLPEMTEKDWEDDKKRATYIDRHERLYDTILWYVDEQIRRMFEGLEHRGDLDDTFVVIVGDHGEGFGEHWESERDILDNPYGPPFGYAHGSNLFQELIKVPMVISGTGKMDDSTPWVSTTDIVPTVLDYLNGLSEVERTFDGQSLFEPTEDRVIHAGGIGEGYEQHAVYVDGDKYVSHPHEEPDFLFDVSRDEFELNNLIEVEARRDRWRELKRLIPESHDHGEDIHLSDTAHQQLKELGYIE